MTAGGSGAKIGVVTVSDRASRGEYSDRGGPAVLAYLAAALSSPWEERHLVVPDQAEAIEGALRRLAEDEGCALIVTTGGTGPAPRDITPDVTAAFCDRLLPGFGERMRAASVAQVPTAILSRQLAGTRGSCLIVNLPGSPAAIAECLDAVFPAIPHAVALLGGAVLTARGAHDPEHE